jgi:hypothetical protein
MKKKCEICGNEFEAVRDTARFCSDKCKKQAYRGSNSELEEEPRVEEGIKKKDLSKLSAEDLYNGISTYKEDKWIDSPEHEELMRRLKELSIEELEEQGFKIPNWKRMEGKEIEI